MTQDSGQLEDLIELQYLKHSKHGLLVDLLPGLLCSL